MIVAIFTCEKHLAISKVAIKYYRTFLPSQLTVIGPKNIAHHFTNADVNFFCDEDINGYETLKSISDQFDTGPTWYLQQFLKIAFYVESGRDVLIIDGDTIISPSLFENITENNIGYYTAEDVSQYNKLLSQSGKILCPSERSYICNFGFFEERNRKFYSSNINQFINDLAQLVIESQEQEGLRYSSVDFSEYQINGQISEGYKSKNLKLKIFRRADLLIRRDLQLKNLTKSRLDEFFRYYDCISYEVDHHVSYIRSLMAEMYLIFRRGW